MPATYEKIASTTLGSASANIDFTSIPSTYTDLRIVWVFKPVSSGNYPYLQFNNNSSALYTYKTLYGNGTATGSQSTNNANGAYLRSDNSAPTTEWQLITLDIFSYAGSTFKTLLNTYAGDINGSGTVSNGMNLWASTSAITSVKLLFDSGSNIAAGSTATLYGILKA